MVLLGGGTDGGWFQRDCMLINVVHNDMGPNVSQCKKVRKKSQNLTGIIKIISLNVSCYT